MSFVRVERSGAVAKLVLSRPDARNAFNAEMIAETTTALKQLGNDSGLRILKIEAEGPTFCAGADVNWMKAQKDVSETANFADAQKVFDMFRAAYEFPRPVIARVQGGAFGGGAGLMCCSDIVVMADDAVTAFSEVRLGIIPATISAFVIRKIGAGRARELFLTGRRISAEQCLDLGLATEVVPALQLDSAVERWVSELLAASPSAQALAKELLREVPFMALDYARDFTAARLARQRVTREGQEGLTSLLEKRKPFWAEGE